MDLDTLAERLRRHPGLRAKRELQAVAAAIGGDGDDAAALPAGDGMVALAAEAIWPDLLARAPRVAGIAGVVTLLNDIAATGATPIAILDVLVAGEGALLQEALAGLRDAADLYGVPVVGGHTTLAPGATPTLATFAAGRVARPLRAARARPGDAVCMAACLEGELIESEDVVMFSHLRGPRRARARADLDVLVEAAAAGEVWAARDVSMPGIAGSLLQLLEAAGGLGCALELGDLPRPTGVALERWLTVFPSYAFLLVGDSDALVTRFSEAGLAAAAIGRLDESGVLSLVGEAGRATLWDLRAEPLTGLGPG